MRRICLRPPPEERGALPDFEPEATTHKKTTMEKSNKTRKVISSPDLSNYNAGNSPLAFQLTQKDRPHRGQRNITI